MNNRQINEARAVVSRCVRWTRTTISSGFLNEGGVAEDQRRDYLVFLDPSAMHRRGSPVGGGIKRDKGGTRVTSFYSWQRNRHRFFAEAHGAGSRAEAGSYNELSAQGGMVFP